MIVVIQDLELAADGRAFTLVHFRVNEILDTAVRTLGDLEINLQDEILVSAHGNDITAIRGLGAVA